MILNLIKLLSCNFPGKYWGRGEQRALFIRILPALVFLMIHTSCSVQEPNTGVIDETETSFSRQLIYENGQPASGVVVYVHTEDLTYPVQSLLRASTSIDPSKHTYRCTTDQHGYYRVIGNFTKNLTHVTVDIHDSIGVFYSYQKADTTGIDTLEEFGVIEIDTVNLDASGYITILQLQKSIAITRSGRMHIRAPKGIYDIQFLDTAGNITNEVVATRVNKKDTVVVHFKKKDPNVIAYWDFSTQNSLLKDFSGNGIHGILGEGNIEVDNSVAEFNGQSGILIPLREKLKVNEFQVSARIMTYTTSELMQNIIVAEPPGMYNDGWILRIEFDTLLFYIRDGDNSNGWIDIRGPSIEPMQWYSISVVKTTDSVLFYVDSVLYSSSSIVGDVSNLQWNLSIGYDGMNQNFHDRYFTGLIDYIKVSKDGFIPKQPDQDSSSVIQDSLIDTVSTVYVDSSIIISFNFDRNDTVLHDSSINSNHGILSKGSLIPNDSGVYFDGRSGFIVPNTSTLIGNYFDIQLRISSQQHTLLQNIIACEPSGGIGNGWILRIENGYVMFYTRDNAIQGNSWTSISSIEPLPLNSLTDIRVQRSENTTSLFINGDEQVSITTTGNIGYTRNNIGIGFDASNQSSRFFIGTISSIQIMSL